MMGAKLLGLAAFILACVFWVTFYGVAGTPAPAQETESAAFARFRYSFFVDPDSARDGLDTTTLAQLDGKDRTKAEVMLMQYLPDARAVIGLGLLGSQRAERRLMRLFEATRDEEGLGPIFLAKALWQIRPDPRWLAALIDVLASADHYIVRMNAAEALYDVRDPAAVHALITALDDPEGLVRHHAARGLLAIHGLADEAVVMKHGPEHMMFRVMSNDPARREGGKRDILAIIVGRPISAL